jgi:hypothetical protein
MAAPGVFRGFVRHRGRACGNDHIASRLLALLARVRSTRISYFKALTGREADWEKL